MDSKGCLRNHIKTSLRSIPVADCWSLAFHCSCIRLQSSFLLGSFLMLELEAQIKPKIPHLHSIFNIAVLA